MDETTGIWAYFAVFFALLAAGVGFPIPEELPVISAGALAAHASVQTPPEHPFWFIIWPLCILGVVISDGFLYGLGRFGGPRLLGSPWVRRHLLKPEKQAKIEQNFHTYGIKILLGARFLPGIRAPIFITAGALRMPLAKFLLADGIYAIPGVSLLFFLSFWFTDSVKAWFGQIHDYVEYVKGPTLLVAVIVVGAWILRAHLRRKVVTGDPHDVPFIGKMDEVPVIGTLVKPTAVDTVPLPKVRAAEPPVRDTASARPVGGHGLPAPHLTSRATEPGFAKLLMPRSILDAIIAQARADEPAECCGFLAGHVGGDRAFVTHRFPLVNAAATPQTRFESSPESTLAAVRQTWTAGVDVLAVYHSHPLGPTTPSRTDLEHSYGSGVANFIVSLICDPPNVGVWWYGEAGYEPAEWEAVPADEPAGWRSTP